MGNADESFLGPRSVRLGFTLSQMLIYTCIDLLTSSDTLDGTLVAPVGLAAAAVAGGVAVTAWIAWDVAADGK